MIDSIALSMAKRLGDLLESKESVEIYAYGLRLVLMLMLNLALVFFAASLLKIIPTTLAFLAVFIPFRAFGGGVHLSTWPRCITIGSFLMLGSSYCAAVVNIQLYQLYILLLFALFITLLSIVKWVPASTEKNPINDFRIIRMQKRNMLITTTVWTCCILSFIYSGNNPIAFAMVLGAIVSAILISPFGFYLMGVIDRMLNRFGKEGTDS